MTSLDADTCSQVRQEGGMPQAAAGSSHRHIWSTSGAKHEVCRGPRYYILLTACILLGMRVCPSLVPCGIALALLPSPPQG